MVRKFKGDGNAGVVNGEMCLWLVQIMSMWVVHVV